MPIHVSCPSCGGTVKAPDNLAGRTVKCPKCGGAMTLPEAEGVVAIQTAPPPAPPRRPAAPRDDDYPEGAPRSYDRDNVASAPQSGNNGMAIAGMVLGIVGFLTVFIPCVGPILGLIMGIIGATLSSIGLASANKIGSGKGMAIAGLVLSILAIVWVPIYFFVVVNLFVRNVGDIGRQFEQAAKNQQQFIQNNPNIFQQGGQPQGAPTPVSGNLTLNNGQGTLQSTLAANDARDRIRGVSACKVFTLNMIAGKTYQIEMVRDNQEENLDPYLRLEDAAGKHLTQDDDSGGFPNARLTFVCSQTGSYRVVATTFLGGSGSFTLKAQEK